MLAHELQESADKYRLDEDAIFRAVAGCTVAAGCLCGGGDDCRLWPARVPRSLRHQALGDRTP